MKADEILEHLAWGFFVIFGFAGLLTYAYACIPTGFSDSCQLNQASPFYITGEVAFLGMAFSLFSLMGIRVYLLLRRPD